MKFPIEVNEEVFYNLPVCKDWKNSFVSKKGNGCIMTNLFIAAGFRNKIITNLSAPHMNERQRYHDFCDELIREIKRQRVFKKTVDEWGLVEKVFSFLRSGPIPQLFGEKYHTIRTRKKFILDTARQFPEVFKIV